MNRWYMLLFSFCLAGLLGLTVFIGSCYDETDEEEEDEQEEFEETPPSYDKELFGWGFGTKTLRYTGGQWQELDEEPFSVTIYGSVFVDQSYGYAYGKRRIFRYSNSEWRRATPANMPPADIIDAVATEDGTVWFAANNTFNEGYLIRATTSGSLNVIPTEGVIASRPIHLVSLCTYPGSNSIHMLGIFDDWYYLFTWNGQAVYTEPIMQIPFVNVGDDDDDDDTSPDDDDDDDDDDDNDDNDNNDDYAKRAPRQKDLIQTLFLTDLVVSPADGAFYATGRDQLAGELRGVVWKRLDVQNWERTELTASSGCKTSNANKLFFLPTGEAFVLAGCNYSQIYGKPLDGAWTEFQLPGEKGEEYALYDIFMLSYNKGYAVGYSSHMKAPLLLQRDPGGWLHTQTYAEADRERIYSVVMFEGQAPGSVSDDDDDDASPTDDDDDTTTDDDDTSPTDDDDDTTTDDDDTSPTGDDDDDDLSDDDMPSANE